MALNGLQEAISPRCWLGTICEFFTNRSKLVQFVLCRDLCTSSQRALTEQSPAWKQFYTCVGASWGSSKNGGGGEEAAKRKRELSVGWLWLFIVFSLMLLVWGRETGQGSKKVGYE